MDRLPTDDPRRAALQRLTESRQRLGQALAPTRASSSGASASGWRHLLQLLRMAQKLLLGSGWGQAGALAGERLSPWVRRHPLWAVGVAAVGGAGLFMARAWLQGAARLQALRWWQTGQALLLQQSLDPAWIQRLLAALPTQAQAPADSPGPKAEPDPEQTRG